MRQSEIIQEQLERFSEEQKRQEHIEHRDVLLAIKGLLKNDQAIKLFEYLFANLEVGTLPANHLEGNLLYEALGFIRAGNSIFDLVCEASSEDAGKILAKIKRKRYEQEFQRYAIENGINIFGDPEDGDDSE